MTGAADEDTTFADLALRPDLLNALTGLGYEEPTPIQREAIPPPLVGRDLVGQAATGTGKTAAFALPLLQRLRATENRPSDDGTDPMALVLVPTRELAVQVSEAVHRYGRHLGARVLPIYGGQPIGRQLRALERGVDVVVATPGRALDHPVLARRGSGRRGPRGDRRIAGYDPQGAEGDRASGTRGRIRATTALRGPLGGDHAPVPCISGA